MFDIVKTKGNTYYYSAFSNVGIYKQGDSAILIDSCDHKRMVRSLDKLLEEDGLRVDTIINTHCHVDHIVGNKFFFDKYGCKILASKKECSFIEYPDREPQFYYIGIDTDKKRNHFFLAESSVAEVITPENTPEGFEIIPLPGHSFEMIGVRTPDNVVFLADAILSKTTWDEYKFPFFCNVNESLETFDKVKSIKADLFVPTHDMPLEDICELADYNKKSLQHKKDMVYELCKGRGFDAVVAAVLEKSGLNLHVSRYPMYIIMIRNLLQSLVEDDAICAVPENMILTYRYK